MKHVIHGRVVGNRLFTPDPKHPDVELMKIEIDLQPLTESTEKNSRGILIVPLEDADQFLLQQCLRVTIEDSQQVLPLGRATSSRAKERKAKDADDLR